MNKFAKKYLSVLLLAVGMFVVSGCGNDNYWPLDKGNMWDYVVRPKEGVVIGSTMFTVKSVESKDGLKKAVVEVTNDDSKRPLSETELVADSTGIYEASRKSIQPTDYTIVKQEIEIAGKNPPYIIKGKPKVGEEWNFASKFRDLAMNSETELRGSGKVEAKDDVDVLAGSFKTFKIRWYTTDSSGNLLREQTYWFHKGVGPVKMEVSTGAGTIVLSLKKAIIGGDKIGNWK